jgi:uncharacterized membrane protein YoaK (UPF0700 family)
VTRRAGEVGRVQVVRGHADGTDGLIHGFQIALLIAAAAAVIATIAVAALLPNQLKCVERFHVDAHTTRSPIGRQRPVRQVRSMTTTELVPGRVTIASATLMTAVAGYVDAFLYLRHQTFGFAQSGNIIFLAVKFVQGGDWLRFFWPVLAYLAGLIVAQLPRMRGVGVTTKNMTAALLVQLIVFVALACLPFDAPTALFVLPLSFIGGIRLELFRSTTGISFVSIATTGNLMRLVEAAADFVHGRTPTGLRATVFSLLVVLGFLGGGLCGAAASNSFGPALWGAVILEAGSFAVFAFHARSGSRDRAAL